MKLRQRIALMKGRTVAAHLLSCVIVLVTTGCESVPGNFPVPGYVRNWVQTGTGVVAGLEDVDVKAAVSSGVKDDELKKVRHLAVMLGTGGHDPAKPQQSFSVGGRDFIGIMEDNIALELTNLGYQVVERTRLDSILNEQGLQMSGVIDLKTVSKVGRIIGVDAIVLGNVTTSHKTQTTTGLLGETVTGDVVSNATMRIADVEKARVLMLVTLSYKKGQKPTEAAKTMAIALSEKLKNPSEKGVSKTK